LRSSRSPFARTSAEITPFPRNLTAGRQPWKLSLAPYAIEAVRIAMPGVQVVDVTAVPDKAAAAELAARLDDLDKRDLNTPRAYLALRNPGFEPVTGAGTPAGWRAATRATLFELDATQPQVGATCAYFRSDNGPAALESDPIPMPATGQLAMTVSVRGQQMAPGSELRMVIESRGGSQLYRRSAIIAAAAGASADIWQAKAILVNDLPLEQRGDVRIRFEMTGPGEVWLDEAQLFDLLFPLKFYKDEEAEILRFVKLNHAAKSAFDEGRIVDCAQITEKYWPRFLAEYTPRIESAAPVQQATNPTTPSAAPPNQGKQPAPGISEHIKRTFPFMK
jgi:hypothetical protein